MRNSRIVTPLSADNQWMRQLFDLAPVPYLILDPSGTVQHANAAASALLGYPLAKLLHLPFQELFAPADQTAVWCRFLQTTLETAASVIFLARIAHPDTPSLLARIHVTPLPGPDGVSFSLLSLSVEAPQDACPAVLRDLFEHAPVAYHEIDRDGIVRRVNAAECSLLGYPQEEILGRPVLDFIAPADRETSRLAIAQKFSEPLPAAPYRRTYLRRDGSEILLEIHDSQVRSSSGEFVGVRSALLDVTERDRADKRLRSALLELENQKFALDHHSIVVATDANGVITYANDKFCAISGYSRDEILGQTHNFIHSGLHSREFYAALWETISSGRVWQGEICNRAKDGFLFWLATTIVALKDDKGLPESYIAIRTDVTGGRQAASELSRIADELRVALDRAEAATVAKSNFLASMSHEIRTPMNGVIGMTGLLLGTSLTPEQRGYAETIRGSGEALLSIINDILDFSKVEAGKLEFESVPFNLHAALEDVLDLLSVRAHEKQLDVLLCYAPDSPRDFLGDPGRIRQVVLNIVSNAIKFTFAGHVLVDVEWKNPADGPSFVRVSVHDTGIGIPADRQAALFQKFHQVDSSTTRKYGGTGLGLAISKELIIRMGGQLRLTSLPGEGSSFSFDLPLSLDPAPPPSPPPPPEWNGLRILVVNAHPICRSVTSSLCSRWKMRVDEAATEEEAIHKISAAFASHDPYLLACLDHRFPGVDGTGIALRLHAAAGQHHLPIVLITAYRAGLDTLFTPAGTIIGSRLSRPVRESALLAAFRKVLTQRPPSDAMVTQASPSLPATGPGQTFPGSRILLVEDNTVNQKVAVAILHKLGCTVDVAANGIEARDMAAGLPYDLIFMDCHMPEMDGFDATREIRRIPGPSQHAPIVALTAGALSQDREKCLAAGMDDYLAKPTKLSEIRDTLSHFLRLSSSSHNALTALPVSKEDQASLVHELLAGDFVRSVARVSQLASRGVSPEELYVNLVQHALYEIGDLWEECKISVAAEHLASSIAGRLLLSIRLSYPALPPAGRSAIVASVTGEQHFLGSRVVADLLELYGWQSRTLGSALPAEHLLTFIGEMRPDLIALSITLVSNLPALLLLLDSIQTSYPTLPVFLGGYAFRSLSPSEFQRFSNVKVFPSIFGLKDALSSLPSATPAH